MEELKEELRSLTVNIDGQQATVAGLFENGRWGVVYIYFDWMSILTLWLFKKTFPCRLFFPCHPSSCTWEGLLCSTGKPQWYNLYIFFLVFNLFSKVILAKTSTGDLELLAILLSSPHSSTHLITQVTTQAYILKLFRFRWPMSSSGESKISQALRQDAC